MFVFSILCKSFLIIKLFQLYCIVVNIIAIMNIEVKALINAEMADGELINSVASDRLLWRHIIIIDVHILLSCCKYVKSSAR